MWAAEAGIHLANVIVLTLTLATFVLWRYRAAVLRGMQVGQGGLLPVPPISAPAKSTIAPDDPSVEALNWERQARRRIALAYMLSVGASALVLAGVYLVASDLPTTPAHFVGVAGVMLSAAMPMIAVSLAVPFWRAFRWWLAALVAGAALLVVVSVLQRLVLGKAATLDQLMNFVYFFQLAANQLWLPFLIFFIIGNRRLRGVAPITFAGMLIFGLAPLAGAQLLRTISSTASGSALISEVGSAWLTFHGGFLLLALPTGWLGWRRLHTLARRYREKKFSDAQLLAHTFWLVFVATQALQLAISVSTPWRALAGCAAAYLIFPPINRFCLARAGLQRGRPPARTLLLLRVFGYVARTQRLFDRVAARWRLFGPVTVIAAPDVVARTVDPGDFLSFVTGRISDSFIQSQADLDARLASLDLAPDPDGRYRVNDFCCRDNTWQATVIELMKRADTVIMDVRGVTAARRGCDFELQQLASRVPGRKVVLVVDRTTDRGVIERAMADAAQDVRLLTVERNATSETHRVFQALLKAAA